MKPRTLRPRPASCKHPLMQLFLRAQGGGVQIEHYVCPDCKVEVMVCLYTLRGKPMTGYNFSPVRL